MAHRYYRIRIRGTLGARFADSFESMSLSYEGGDTVLSGVCVDSSALFGVLDQLRDLGLDLLDVRSVEGRSLDQC
jgi:hypothetical protein